MTIEKVKGFSKLLCGKILLFCFILLFINSHNLLFGSENSIVGVILLMSTLMLMNADFGFDARRVGGMMPVLFVAIGIFAKLALINPYLGILVNFAVLASILVVTREDKTKSNYLPFAMGYLMMQGYDVSGEQFVKRILSLAVIGSMIGLLNYLVNRKKTYDVTFRELCSRVSLSSTWGRWAVMLSVTVVGTLFLGQFIGFSKTMWISLTVLSLFSPIEGHYQSRRYLRIPGTILGCVLFYVLSQYLLTPQNQGLIMLMGGFLSMFLSHYFLKTIYNSFSALFTASMVFPVVDAISLRILANITGVVIAIVSYVIFVKIFCKFDRANQLECEVY